VSDDLRGVRTEYGAWSVAYWVVAVLLYAGLGVLYPPAAMLGFWQSALFVLLAHLARPRVMRLLGRRPAP
jgi:hypothetical protein